MLSTWTPKDYGFYRFENRREGRSEENMANKGLLWSYFVDLEDGNKCGTLVFNTHLSTSNAVIMRQIEEIKDHFERIRDEVIWDTQHFEFYLMGDFNSKLDSDAMVKLKKSMNLTHISTEKPTNGEQTESIDHIFVWRKKRDSKLTNAMNVQYVKSEVIKPWEKEHEECPKTVDSLSDHCWQAVAVME